MNITEGYMPYLGYQTYYRIAGECRDGKQPLLLLHGGPGSTHNYFEAADINLGTGMVVIGLASLIIGETLFGRGGMWVKAAAAVAGSVIYRFIIALALRANVPSECLKLISAVIVALAIAAPALKKNLALRRRRAVSQKGGKTHA